MDLFLKSLEVLRICLPVFLLMGLGREMKRRGWMNESHQTFINGLIYNCALPFLVFAELSRQDFRIFLNASLFVSVVVAIAASALLFFLIAKVLRFKGAYVGPFIFVTYWCNGAYLGFPLADFAFGAEKGLAIAAIVNAFTIPIFVGSSLYLALWSGEKHGPDSSRPTFVKLLFNPPLIAALVGMLVSLLITAIRVKGIPIPSPLTTIVVSGHNFFKLGGSMGFPLALITIGAALEFKSFSAYRLPIFLSTVGKLVVSPFITFAVFYFFFPDAPKEVRGVAVLLMATPSAVASYIITRQLKIGEDFTAAVLVISTIASIVTIPVWLFFLI